MKNDEKDILFEEYKLYIESLEKKSERRDALNTYYITINSALFVLAGVAFQFVDDNRSLIITSICFLGIVISILFMLMFEAFKKTSDAKYSVIYKIEKQLPVQPFDDEWKELQKNGRYISLSRLHSLIPVIFLSFYLIAMIAILVFQIII